MFAVLKMFMVYMVPSAFVVYGLWCPMCFKRVVLEVSMVYMSLGAFAV